MLIKNQHPLNKSIMVSILGAPNVGKSSLINYLLGFDLSVVHKRAQTTRNRFHCNFIIDRTEIILVDTPGIHRSNKEFNKRINQQAREGSQGVDVNLLLIDLTMNVLQQFQDFKDNYKRELSKIWPIFTKIDLVDGYESLPLDEILVKARAMLPGIEKYFSVSSTEGTNIHLLTGELLECAESGPHLYPDGEVSSKNERFFTAEYIREQIFKLISEEIPYETAVVIDEFNEVNRGGVVARISASILVNRQSQRAIIVGTQGGMVKKIGTAARRRIEEMLGGQIHLKLHVKVSTKWFKNNFVLEQLGLPRSEDSARVWRAKT